MRYSHILFGAAFLLAGAGCTPAVNAPIEEEATEDVVEDLAVMEAKGDKTYTNEEYDFSFTYNPRWTLSEHDDDTVVLDMLGEGPNPYSYDTGEGTNPSDDVTVAVTQIDDIVAYLENAVITGYAPDAKPLLIDGHQASAYRGAGITNFFHYLVQIQDRDYIVVSGQSEISEHVAAVALSLRFDE